MRHIDPFNRLESVTSQLTDWGFHDANLNDYQQDLTPRDLCLFGKPGPKCGCGFCAEMVARQREGSNRI